MTGDWVQFHHKGVEIVSETAPRCKTVDVDYVGQITRVYVDINDENGEFVVKTLPNEYEKEAGLYVMRGFVLNPVPLTAEILEKNGFERKEEDRGFSEPYCVYVNDDFQYVVKVYPKDGMDRYSRLIIGEYDDNEYMSLLINQVHELQHALRLCGIDKEIEL